jgi:hypothetical protein
MNSIYPSEVVRFIDEIFPWAKTGRDASVQGNLRLDQLSNVFGSLVELVQRIPSELLAADEKKRAHLLIATTQSENSFSPVDRDLFCIGRRRHLESVSVILSRTFGKPSLAYQIKLFRRPRRCLHS